MKENYQGSIELISGLIQKNKGDFPLMEANAVAFYEEDKDGNVHEIRLPKKLETLGISENEKQNLIQSAVQETLNSQSIQAINTNIATNANNIGNLETSLNELQMKVDANTGDNENLIILYKESEQKLYLYEKSDEGDIELEDGQKVFLLSETIVTGGGGGAGTTATYKLSLKVANDKSVFSVLQGRAVSLDYTISLKQNTGEVDEEGNSIYTEVTAEKVTYSIYKDNVFQKSITKDTVKDGSLDITDLLTLGGNNFKVVASVSEHVEGLDEPIVTRSTARWTVNVINMILEVPTPGDTWENTPKTGAASFVYKVVGALTKKVHFIIDGDEEGAHVETITASDYSSTYTIPRQSHGIHTFEVYCEGTIENETIQTDRTKYVLMFIDTSSSKPIIRIKAADSAEQYSSTTIEYSVYDPASEIISLLEVFEDNVLQTSIVNIPSAQPNISTKREWVYKPQTEGHKVIKFKYKDTEATVQIEVSKFPYKVTPVLGDLKVDFVPTGRTNQDIDYNTFKNNAFDEEGQEIPMSWIFSDNFDWVNGGWKTDDSGDTYFCVKAGTSVTFDYNLFNKENTVAQKDANGNYSIAGTGKEFKLIFKTANVARSDATWLSCMANAENDNPTGLEMQAHNAYVKSNFDSLEIPYSEEDIIEFDLNIVPITQFSDTYEPVFESKVIPMFITYEDGTPAQPKTITNPATSFKQSKAVPITVGSEYCDVYIYRMKIYERYLEESEILTNFIADARSGEEMAKRYLRNQIYMSGQNSFSGTEQDLITLAEACPDLRIYLISAPYFTNNKSDKVPNTTFKQFYYKNGKNSLYDNWTAEGGIHNGQGTSSNEYGYAGRNLEFNMKGTEFLLADNVTKVKKVPLSETSVPNNYFNFKINVASSEHANNPILQKRYDRYLPYESLASQRDERIKNSMEFFNAVVFIQETNPDLSTHREFNDTKIHFYGIGNIGDSKKTDNTRLNDPEDDKEFCIEIMDWTQPLSSFPADTMMQAMQTTQDGQYVWAKDENLDILYELKNGKYEKTTDQKVDTSKTYYVDILENDDFSENYTYGWRYITEYDEGDEVNGEPLGAEEAQQKNDEIQAAAKKVWIDFYRFLTRDLTTNGVEDQQKVNAWKNEFKDWFILDAALYYYLYTLRYTMIDNRAKNSFWHYGKCTDGKYRFDFWDYDNDTALGIDNAGKMDIPFGVEEDDVDSAGAAYFRGHDSTFFVRIAKYFSSELVDMWAKVEQNSSLGNAFDSTSLVNEFDEWQEQFPEELWRLAYERVYKRTYVGGEGSDWDNALPKKVNGVKTTEKRYLNEMMNGRKKYHRRQFERNQDAYMSSKFFGSTNYSNSITLRGSGSSTSHFIPAQYILNIIPFTKMYLNLHDGTKNFYHQKLEAGQEYTINLMDSLSNFDLFYIRGASNLQSLGDLSLLYLQTATLGAGSKLKQILLGNGTEGYSNGALKTLEIGSSNKLLEELDIRNLSNLQSTDLPVSGIPGLKRVYAQGSNIATARFANNGLLEEAYLPKTITQLQLRNLYFLKTLEVESYENLTDLTIENCNGVNSLNIVKNAPKLKTVKVTNVNWNENNKDNIDTTLLNRLVSIDSNITGKIYVPFIRQTEINDYVKKWGADVKQKDEIKETSADLVIEYGEVITQYLVSFYDALEGKELGSVWVDERDYCPDPIATGVFEKPIKESTAEFDFTHIGWNLTGVGNTTSDIINLSTFIIDTNQTFYAIYSQTTREYTVSWYGSNEITPLQTVTVPYNQPAVYTESTPQKEFAGNYYSLFVGWDKSTARVTENMKVNAIWASANPTIVKNKLLSGTDMSELEPVEIYALGKIFDANSVTGDDVFNVGDYISLQLGYMPSYSEDESEERVLIEEDLELDGKTYKVFNDIELFKEDKDFVIALDFTPGYNEGSLGSYLSCYRGANESGVRISATGGSAAVIKWTQNTPLEVSPVKTHIPTASQTYREIVVLRHVKGSNTLQVYRNNRYSLDAVTSTSLLDGDGTTYPSLSSGKYPLVLGADYNASTSTASNIAKAGTIHYAKVWFKDIGDEECKKVCAWVYNKMYFDYCGANRYYYADGTDTKCSASFVAQDLLDGRYVMYQSPKKGGWALSDMRKWVNEKVFIGLPIIWQQILREVMIKSMQSGGSGSAEAAGRKTITTSKNYFYLPSLYEVNSGTNGELDEYKSELTETSDTTYPVFGTSEEKDTRIKYTDGTEQPDYWYLRTPYVPSSITNDGGIRYYTTVSIDGTAENTMSFQDPETGSYEYYNMNRERGVLLCFSI